MLESSLREEIQRYCQGKFLSMAILRGMSFSPKSWLLGYSTGARLVTCLGKNCPVITPTQKDSKMSFTPSQNPRPRQLDHSAEILHSSMRLIFATTYPTKNVVRGDHSGEVSDSDSDSESGPGSCSDSDLHKESISGSEHSSEKCKVSLKQSYNFINYLNPIT